MTKKRRAVLDFLITFIAQNRYSPSIDEIRIGLGLRSPATVHKHLAALERDGHVTHDFHKMRSWEPTHGPLPNGREFIYDRYHGILEVVWKAPRRPEQAA